ncbi:SRPBCC domain-containing protein [Parasphingopyxis marina]|uniref:SRPBCC domain-containing protein n=1 Tax=Parasphingopyxis marina TaxID=2761622 RepID=A0A842I2S9_9SPHN|nr:SRPBCC domain-containing protein [Parasphingopyxis marina]MBC2778590.1 SRPBCC domain-containing protein [Parasphingopyxis marina]
MTDQQFELEISRYIDAPPDLVWEILSERMEEWWCPKPWRVEIVEQDRRAGGRCAMTMYGPDGEVMPNEGIFLEWTEGKRFVTTDAVTADHSPSGPFMIGFWEIGAEGEGTRFTGRARHWTEEAMKQHEEMGFTTGWSAVAAQLAEICEAEAKAEA